MTSVVRGILSISMIISIITSGFIGLLFLDAIVDTAGVFGANITVAQGGGGDYTSIQDAIDNASAGDTIYVWDGLYYEHVEVDKTLSLIGNGSATTFINGSRLGDVVNVTADWVNITGFTIQYSGNLTGYPFPVDCGIEIYYADHVHIYDNNCSASQFGMFLYYSNWCNIEDNEIDWNSWYGLVSFYSENCSLSNNIVNINSWDGILVINSHHSSVIKNTCKFNNDYGMGIVNSNWVVIKDNNCSYNGWYGMEISGSNYCQLINNSCFYNDEGVDIWWCRNILISENTINYNYWDGLYIDEAENCTVRNNTFNSNWGEGIYVWGGNNDFQNNTCSFNSNNGLYLSYSNINVFSNNTFESNFNDGIYIDEARNNIFSNNTIIFNSNNGIELTYSSRRNLFYNNNISQNNNGIYIEDSSTFNDFTENIIASNSGRGVYIRSSCNYNKFYHNLILSNTNQATDESSNDWSYNQEGNYWSDYTGLDNGNNGRVKGDGIGDTNLPHPASGMDSYPFIKPYGWRYPGVPDMVDPGVVDLDGTYDVTWNQTIRASGYVVEEDVTSTFDSPTEIYNGANLKVKVENRTANTYYYRARAYNGSLISVWSDIVDMIVDAAPTTPTDLVAENPMANSVNLTWNPSVDSGLFGYYILINDSEKTDAFHRLTTISPLETHYTVIGLAEETTYYFGVIAFDHYNLNSSMSNIAHVTTLDATAPAAPKDLEAYTESDSEIDLTWTANSESDISGYILFMNETASGPTSKFVPIVMLNSSYTTYTVIGLAEQTTYYFKIKAFDEVPNNSSFSNVTSATTLDLTPPSAPEGLKIINPTINSLTLTWNASPEADVVGYFIYQGSLKDGQFKKLNNVTLFELQFIDTGLEEYTRYFYKIQAIDDVGLNSSYSLVIAGKTLLGPKPPELNNSIDDFEIPEDSYDNTSIRLYHIFMDPNDDPLAFTVEGEDYLTVTIYQGNGTVIIRPEPEWSGSESLTFYATDGTKEVSFKVKITVTPVNDPPGPAKIVSFDDGLKITQGEAIDLEGECDDIDISYGDELTFKWYSSISNYLGTGKLVENVVLSAGKHVITLEVSDKAGMTANATATITVQKKGATDSGVMGYIVPIALVIVIVIVLIIVFLFMRKSKKKKTEREEKGADIDKVDAETPTEQTPQPFQQLVGPMMPPGVQPVIGMPGQAIDGMPPMYMQMPMPLQFPPPQPGMPLMQQQMQIPTQPLLQTPTVPPPYQEQTQMEQTTTQPALQPTQELLPELPPPEVHAEPGPEQEPTTETKLNPQQAPDTSQGENQEEI